MKVSVIIPTKNEEENIKDILEKVKGFGDEILVVDGHSSDRTREIAEGLGVKFILDNGKGKGDGLRCSIREAKG